MIQTVIRSDGLEPGEGFAFLDSAWGTCSDPMRVAARTPADFQVALGKLDLGPAHLVQLTATTSQVERTPRLIRQADPELAYVVVPLTGSLGIEQAGRTTVVHPWQLAFYDSSRPFRMRLGGQDGATELLRLHLPRAAMAMPEHVLKQLLAQPLPADAGVGGLLARFLHGIATDPEAFPPADALRVGTVAQDLLRALLAHYTDAQDAVADGGRHRALLTRIDAFIHDNLHDPQLSPRAVAAAHHISPSYLHRLFQTREITVAAWIRTQRLERARRALGDGALRTIPVHQIARRCGFSGHATFTRAFRAAYGTAPIDYRRLGFPSVR